MSNTTELVPIPSAEIAILEKTVTAVELFKDPASLDAILDGRIRNVEVNF